MRADVPDRMLDRLGGSAFAMNRAKKNWGDIAWEQHSVYKNCMILRAVSRHSLLTVKTQFIFSPSMRMMTLSSPLAYCLLM